MNMAASTKACVLSLVGLIVCPVLLFMEVVAFMLADMIIYEPSNPLVIKIIAGVVVIVSGVGTVALPCTAFIMGGRARSVIRVRDTPVAGASMSLVAQVIAGVVVVGVVLVQIFMVLWAAGVCSLDGC
jgi:hypothetical protein